VVEDGVVVVIEEGIEVLLGTRLIEVDQGEHHSTLRFRLRVLTPCFALAEEEEEDIKMEPTLLFTQKLVAVAAFHVALAWNVLPLIFLCFRYLVTLVPYLKPLIQPYYTSALPN
jgi:hypothetical protein